MIDRRREDSALREEFSVLGSTGNVCHIDALVLYFVPSLLTIALQVYTVVINKTPSCNCMALFFIALRVASS